MGRRVLHGVETKLFCSFDVTGDVVDEEDLLRRDACQFGGGLVNLGVGLHRLDAEAEGQDLESARDDFVAARREVVEVRFARVREQAQTIPGLPQLRDDRGDGGIQLEDRATGQFELVVVGTGVGLAAEGLVELLIRQGAQLGMRCRSTLTIMIFSSANHFL